MPIDYKDYGRNFVVLSRVLRMFGKCAVCGAENHKGHPETGSEVVLTVHHLDGDIKNNDLLNLVPLCQRCHLGCHRGELKAADPVSKEWHEWLDGILEFVLAVLAFNRGKRDQGLGIREVACDES